MAPFRHTPLDDKNRASVRRTLADCDHLSVQTPGQSAVWGSGFGSLGSRVQGLELKFLGARRRVCGSRGWGLSVGAWRFVYAQCNPGKYMEIVGIHNVGDDTAKHHQ